MAERLLIWAGIEDWRSEVAAVELSSDGVRASGTQVGLEPLPYRLDYRLEAPKRYVTRELDVHVIGEGWSRRLELRHEGAGIWSCHAEARGRPELGEPGGDAAPLSEALDCDLGLSPLTNLMPIRRHELHEHAGYAEFLMAWVSVPDLGVHASRQRYEHVRPGVVRYVDLGLYRGFAAELELDGDGLVVDYPQLARRIP